MHGRSTNPILFGLSFGLSILGCGAPTASAGATPPSSGATATEPPPETPPTTETTSGGPSLYEVHEWGVIDVQEGGASEVAAGAGRPPPSMSVRKPVLYFHLDPSIDRLSVDVSARIVGGTIYETYPADTRPSPDVAHWSASLRPAHCATQPDGTPSGDEASRDRGRRWVRACDTPDGICEVTELPRYDASTASCVEVGGVQAGMLFYRGVTSPRLPLSVERLDDFSVRVTSTGDMTGAPNVVLRVSTAMTGPWPMGHVVISRVALPERGASVSLPVGSVAVDRTATRAELAVHLAALGLDAAESTAFLDEWVTGLFGAEPGAAPTGAPPIPQDAVIYLLPESAVDGIAHLELSPAPGRLRRAFVVRVILPAVATG